MFNFKKMSALICMLFSLSFFNFVGAYDKFAKVVFIGLYGTGKTVLYNLLTPKNYQKTIAQTIHTKQISTEKDIYNIDGKSICVYFGDTSGEPRHTDLMRAFCHNAHVVFITMDAVKLANMGLSGDKDSEYLEELITHLYEYAPNSRVVVVLTKMADVDRMCGDDKKKLFFLKNKIKTYIQGIEFSVKGNVDNTYELMLYNPSDEKKLKELGKSKEQVENEKSGHRDELKGIVEECLRKYGVDKLPDTSDGLRAEVIKEMVGWHKVVDKEEGTCSSEQSHMEADYEDKLYVKWLKPEILNFLVFCKFKTQTKPKFLGFDLIFTLNTTFDKFRRFF